MSTFLARRIAIGLFTIWVSTFIVYALIRSMPGTALTANMGEDLSRKLDPEQLELLKKAYGLDKPWYLAYWGWIGKIITGDWGTSLAPSRKPVLEEITRTLPATLLLSITAFLVTFLLAIPIGLYTTAKQGTWIEQLISSLLYMLYALPVFVSGLLMIYWFYFKLGWLPGFGRESPEAQLAGLSFWGRILDVVRHAIMPVICFTYPSLAYYSRFIRANLREVLRQDYIRTAQAKGVSPYKVLTKHAFRNTLIPLVTVIGLYLPALVSGGVITERIFNWPGTGTLLFTSIGQRDYPMVMGLVLLLSVMTVLGQLLADLLYGIVDPRVSRQ